MDRFRLDGMVAVVTGAGGSLGSAAAEAFAEAGADVALLGRTLAKLEKAAERVTKHGKRATIIQVDVTDEVSVGKSLTATLAAFDHVDVLFNNAGVSSPKAFLDYTTADWDTVIDTNLTGAFLVSRAFAPAMVKRKKGSIINMGSILSGRGMALRSAYCASKAGLANFGAAMAFELGPHGITVNTIGATVMVTDFNREVIKKQPELYAKVRERSAFGRLGEIDDMLGLLIFLASPASRFITGQTIYMDGGYTAG